MCGISLKHNMKFSEKWQGEIPKTFDECLKRSETALQAI
jgi:hypothetical protein